MSPLLWCAESAAVVVVARHVVGEAPAVAVPVAAVEVAGSERGGDQGEDEQADGSADVHAGSSKGGKERSGRRTVVPGLPTWLPSSPAGIEQIRMAMRTTTPLLVLALASLASRVAAQEPVLPAVSAVTARVVEQLGLDGAGLSVLRDGEPIHLSVYAGFLPDTVLPIASASKWLATATILTLVDEGKLDLDVQVARYLTEFDRADKRTVTLRQCL